MSSFACIVLIHVVVSNFLTAVYICIYSLFAQQLFLRVFIDSILRTLCFLKKDCIIPKNDVLTQTYTHTYVALASYAKFHLFTVVGGFCAFSVGTSDTLKTTQQNRSYFGVDFCSTNCVYSHVKQVLCCMHHCLFQYAISNSYT